MTQDTPAPSLPIPSDELPPIGDLLTVLDDAVDLTAGLIDYTPHHIHQAGEQDRDTLLLGQDNLQRAWAHLMTARRYLREVDRG